MEEGPGLLEVTLSLAEHYNNLNVTQIFLIPTPPALKYLQYLIQIFYRILGKFLEKLPMKRCSVLDNF